MKSKTENNIPLYYKETFIPGSLFCCSDEYLFIFETIYRAKLAANDPEHSSPLSLHGRETEDYAHYIIEHCQDTFNERVLYSYPGEILFLVKKGSVHWTGINDKAYLKILSGRTAGWIVVRPNQNLIMVENKTGPLNG